MDHMKEILPEASPKKENPLFLFMGIGSLLYAFFYTLFLYQNGSGITYPFFVGGTCLFFFFYLKKSGTAVKKFSVFITVSLILLGISTCLTDSWILHFFNKLGIFCLFFYLFLHSLYEDNKWDLGKYISTVLNIMFSSLLYLSKPFTDINVFIKSKKATQNKAEGKGKYVLYGLLLALPLLLVIIFLLGSADAVFGNLVNHLFDFEISGDFGGICFSFLFAFFAAYSILYRLSVHDIEEDIPDKRTAEPIMAITFTGLLSLVYAIFCFIQIVYLFGGYGSLPDGYTYAQYAREGFFQLVFVCLINLSLVLLCRKYFRENIILKGILTFISLCTFIMIASSAYRMILYIQVYYLTFLRIFVLWALVVICLLMCGALITIYKDNFPLTKFCIVTVTVLYILFSFMHPDYWIARYNLSHAVSVSEAQEMPAGHFQDFYYIRRLSLDAAPVIFARADELEYGQYKDDINWFYYYSKEIADAKIQEIPLRKYNFSRQSAYNLYVKYTETKNAIR